MLFTIKQKIAYLRASFFLKEFSFDIFFSLRNLE